MPDPNPLFQTSVIPQNSTIIIGLSGGPDSIYLLHQLHAVADELNLKLIAAHLNHEWQASAQQAQDLCEQTCKNLQIPFVAKKKFELPVQPIWNGSQEEVGRNMRRYFFESLAQEYKAGAVALAHHAQDQHETFFIRLLRGAGLAGLAGIQPVDGLYVRPMLQISKTEILNYLETHKIPYYIDPSNSSDLYLRNKIRNHVIPALQAADQRFAQNLTAAMDHLHQVNDFLQQQATEILHQPENAQGLPIDYFLQLHPVLAQQILLTLLIQAQLPFTPSQNLFKEIVRFLHNNKGNQHLLHQAWMIKKEKGRFRLMKIENAKNILHTNSGPTNPTDSYVFAKASTHKPPKARLSAVASAKDEAPTGPAGEATAEPKGLKKKKCLTKLYEF